MTVFKIRRTVTMSKTAYDLDDYCCEFGDEGGNKHDKKDAGGKCCDVNLNNTATYQSRLSNHPTINWKPKSDFVYEEIS